jgi:hypothetical protein
LQTLISDTKTSKLAARLALFAGALAIVFAGAALAGAAIGPEPDQGEMAGGHESSEPAAHEGGAEAAPGLAVADHGLRLELERRVYDAGADRPLAFRILGDDGEPVTDYQVEHEREMHLIVVRRDFEGFQHLHPRLGADGTWRARADLSRPGDYRVFADFATAAGPATLGSDLFVRGVFEPVPLPPAERVADAGDGYEVELAASGEELVFTVTRDGEEVGDVDPYLGADGHLVALREGDLAFLHTHPAGEAGGPIEFGVEYPSEGRYRLFFQFKRDGEVRTAAFTREVSDESGH